MNTGSIVAIVVVLVVVGLAWQFLRSRKRDDRPTAPPPEQGDTVVEPATLVVAAPATPPAVAPPAPRPAPVPPPPATAAPALVRPLPAPDPQPAGPPPESVT